MGSEANVVRVFRGWNAIAPQQPTTPEDPADPVYRWEVLDAAIRDVSDRGLMPIVALTGAPDWAEGAGRPAIAFRGTWRPQAGAYGRFARALATRYSGRYPDPQRPGRSLPRVRRYEPWNEPNLHRFLAPQWVKKKGRWRAASPGIYRSLLNSFARGVKAIDRRNQVLAGATAPFGDLHRGGGRFPPAQFVRHLLAKRTVFDVLTHHPYSTRGPFAPAYGPDDVSAPDMRKLSRPLRRAERAGRISPPGRKGLWVTEFSYDSSPPDPDGVPERRHARWLAETFFQLQRQGVNLIIWLRIRDQAPEPSYAETYQSGIYFRDGTPKLAQRAFSFPFVAKAQRGRKPLLWTRTPRAGRVVFERKTKRGWRVVAHGRKARHHVLTRRAKAPKGTVMRARRGGMTSLPAKVR